jgi:hypothetical protein
VGGVGLDRLPLFCASVAQRPTSCQPQAIALHRVLGAANAALVVAVRVALGNQDSSGNYAARPAATHH